MKIKCCYRLIPNGEVIHTEYDTESGVILGMPEIWLQSACMELPEYSRNSYINCTSRFDEMCETVLLSDDAYALVVENNNIGYYILQFDGVKRFVRSVTDNRESTSDSYIPNSGLFESIGFRRTKQRQVRSSAGIYRLTYCSHDGMIYTNDGVLKPEFEVTRLSKVNYHYAGYKDMIAVDKYAVVYIDGDPAFLSKTDNNTLVLDKPAERSLYAYSE